MKIAIVGPGAIGLSLARSLKKTGLEPILLARDAEKAALLRDGAEFKGFPPGNGDSTENISFDATENPLRLSEADIVFILVKTYDSANAVAPLRGILPKACIVASLQNGLGNDEILRAAFPANPLVIGSITVGAFRTGKAAVGYGGPGEVVVGNVSGEGAAEIADLLSRAGIKARATQDPLRAVWEKAILNAGINPIAALVDSPNGAILESEALLSLQRDVVLEAATVARARGIDIDGASMALRVRSACERTAGNLCSMVQDVRAGRKTEIDAINGRIAAYAGESGIPAPVNETLARLVSGLVSGLAGRRDPA